MVAFAKIRESRFRCLVSTKVCGVDFSDVAEYDSDEVNDVSNGESICIWRTARGELGSPHGDRGGKVGMVAIKSG